jgi:hypothetical protein
MAMSKGDLVRNKKSRQVYHVMRINDDGTLRLYKHGRPRVRRANPANWELVTMKPLVGSKPPAPEVVVYHLSGEEAA